MVCAVPLKLRAYAVEADLLTTSKASAKRQLKVEVMAFRPHKQYPVYIDQ